MKSRFELSLPAWKQSCGLLALRTGIQALLCLMPTFGVTQTLQVLHRFSGEDGRYPGPVMVSEGTIYGTASGGTNDCGVVYALRVDGSEFRVLKTFTGTNGDGGSPQAGLILSGATLYGTTASGGTGGKGTVFKLNTNGAGYGVLKHFSGEDGASPVAALLLAGTSLYGTTAYGGTADKGTIFKLETDGSGFQVLTNFTGGVSGANPRSRLVLSDAMLYGTTYMGGVSNFGTVYRLNLDGSGLSLLKHFTDIYTAYYPRSGLVVSGSTIYGSADIYNNYWGGLFKLNTDGSDFEVIFCAPGPDISTGALRGMSGPVLCGSTLFATTPGMDPHAPRPNNFGTILSVNTEGGSYRVLHTFDFTNGANPSLELAFDGTTLFGTTRYGGNSNLYDLGKGVVFSLSLPTPAIDPTCQTAEIGSTVSLAVRDTAFDQLAYLWFFNETNLIACCKSLLLSNVQPDQSGAYNVADTNSPRAVTSAPAMLSVIPQVERRSVPWIGLAADPGAYLNVEWCDEFLPVPNWLPLETVNMTSTSHWCFDVSTPLPPQRYYRASQPGGTGAVLSLNLNMIPALTLAGSPGANVRVDGINAIGPTDAWFTLDTVTLTNASQLYFDLTAPGQPRRLYRLVPVP